MKILYSAWDSCSLRFFAMLCVLFLALEGCDRRVVVIQPRPNPVQPTVQPQPIGGCCMMATVTHVDEAWTTNGDGGITVSVGNDLISVSVVGWPGPKPATEVKLKTVKYLTEMVGKKVVVCGSWEGHSFVATSIKEYP